MFGYSKGKGKSYFDTRGYGKGYGRGYSHDRWNANEWNDSFKKKSHKDSTGVDYTLCFHCGHLRHNANSCTLDVEQRKDNVIKKINFESRRMLEREHEHSLFTFGLGEHLKDMFNLRRCPIPSMLSFWRAFRLLRVHMYSGTLNKNWTIALRFSRIVLMALPLCLSRP